MEPESRLLEVASRLGIDFQEPHTIVRVLCSELQLSPGTLYGWLGTERGIEYLKEKYGQTIPMDLESNSNVGKGNTQEVSVV
jgi:hypothetical protein